MIRTIQCAALALAVMLSVAALMAAFSLLSPDVQVAIVGGIERGFVALVANAAAVAGAIGAIAATVLTWLNGRKATAAVRAAEGAQAVAVESRTVLAEKIDKNTQCTVDIKETAVRSHHEVTQAFMAGKREGYVGGIAEGKKQATQPGDLG